MHLPHYKSLKSVFQLALYISLAILLVTLIVSYNSNKIDELKRRNDSLLSADMKDYGKYLGVLNDLKNARDSIRELSNQLYQNVHPVEKTYVFIAIDFTKSEFTGPKKANCVSEILIYDSLSEEAKYKLLDEYTNTFLQKNNIIDENSINQRKAFSFNSYVDASKKREDVLKYGIDQ